MEVNKAEKFIRGLPAMLAAVVLAFGLAGCKNEAEKTGDAAGNAAGQPVESTTQATDKTGEPASPTMGNGGEAADATKEKAGGDATAKKIMNRAKGAADGPAQ